MFTLRELINETAYNKLVESYTDVDNFYYDESVYYDNRNISATQKPTISSSYYYNQYVPYVYRNARNEYVTIESNIQSIIDGIINLINMYNPTLGYATNPFLDTVVIDGDVSDYELRVTDKLFKITNFTINNSYLSPFKYEVIVAVLDPEDMMTNVKLYSTIDSFPFPKNTYFLTTYSLFTNYILKKVGAENSSETTRIIEDINTKSAEMIEIVDTNVLETYIKFDSSDDSITIETIDINDITNDISTFDILNNNGFISGTITYIRWSKYNQSLLKIEGTDLDLLVYESSADEWETVDTPNTFNVTETPVTILLDNNVIVTDDVMTVGEYISDGTNSYKILTVTEPLTVTLQSTNELSVGDIITDGVTEFTILTVSSELVDNTTIYTYTIKTNVELNVGDIITDNGNDYDVTNVTGSLPPYNVTYSQSVISDAITVGTNYTFSPIIQPDVLTTTETEKEALVNTIVNNLQVFVFDFSLSGVEIMDLEYYQISISDDNVDYGVVHDSLLEYITLEQEKIVERGA